MNQIKTIKIKSSLSLPTLSLSIYLSTYLSICLSHTLLLFWEIYLIFSKANSCSNSNINNLK